MLELKGLNFWKERMRKFALRVTDLKQLIQSQMDEKRNFATFMLTAMTTLLAPMTIYTGYFGMNFDNMTELTADKSDNFPGVAKMWAISGLSYGILLLLGIHFRILYSVS
jgi:Mg2+ and Co2+ transporter CorA